MFKHPKQAKEKLPVKTVPYFSDNYKRTRPNEHFHSLQSIPSGFTSMALTTVPLQICDLDQIRFLKYLVPICKPRTRLEGIKKEKIYKGLEI